MEQREVPGTLAVCKITCPTEEAPTLEDLKLTVTIIKDAFGEVFTEKELNFYITTSSLKLGSIVLEASIWVGGIASFLKLYPSVKKGLLELIEDAKLLINKMLRQKSSEQHREAMPNVDLISVIEQMPNLSSIFLMGLDLFQLYTISYNQQSQLKDAKYLITKYSELGTKLAINLDRIFIKILKTELEGFKETEKALSKFGQKYVSTFNLGIQIMNFISSLSHCYEHRKYEVLDKIAEQVTIYIKELQLSEKLLQEVHQIKENIHDLILLSHEDFENEKNMILERLVNVCIEAMDSKV